MASHLTACLAVDGALGFDAGDGGEAGRLRLSRVAAIGEQPRPRHGLPRCGGPRCGRVVGVRRLENGQRGRVCEEGRDLRQHRRAVVLELEEIVASAAPSRSARASHLSLVRARAWSACRPIRIQPLRLSEIELCTGIAQAEPGAVIEYHRGFLAPDRTLFGLLAVEPLGCYRSALAAWQNIQAAVAEPSALLRQRTQRLRSAMSSERRLR